jgi:hypothetical protein
MATLSAQSTLFRHWKREAAGSDRAAAAEVPDPLAARSCRNECVPQTQLIRWTMVAVSATIDPDLDFASYYFSQLRVPVTGRRPEQVP